MEIGRSRPVYRAVGVSSLGRGTISVDSTLPTGGTIIVGRRILRVRRFPVGLGRFIIGRR